jgi:hypothetical protein
MVDEGGTHQGAAFCCVVAKTAKNKLAFSPFFLPWKQVSFLCGFPQKAVINSKVKRATAPTVQNIGAGDAYQAGANLD